MLLVIFPVLIMRAQPFSEFQITVPCLPRIQVMPFVSADGSLLFHSLFLQALLMVTISVEAGPQPRRFPKLAEQIAGSSISDH
jgi:hypothetical protein